MSYLHHLIENATDILDISGQRFTIDRQLTIDRPIQVFANRATITVVDHTTEKFPQHGAIVWSPDSAGGSWDGGLLVGPGRVDHDLSGIITTHGVALSRTKVRDFEYALYTLKGYAPSMRGCAGEQEFEPPWEGLNYGIVCNAQNALIDHCRIWADRHSLVFGEEAQGNIANGCNLTNHADVNSLAFKPNSADNSVINSKIWGTVNLGGDRQQIRNCHIYGRNEYPQPSIPFVCPSSSLKTFDHIIDGNWIYAKPERSGDFYGCIYMHLPNGQGTLQFTNNRWYIEGTNIEAPFVVGISGTLMADPGGSDVPNLLEHSNILGRSPRA